MGDDDFQRVIEKIDRGIEQHEKGRLTEALAAYDEAIRLSETLNLSVVEYCNALASAYHNKGLTLRALDTPQALADAITAYDEAIRLGKTLDLSVAEYCNALASAYHNKGLTLRALDTPQALADAITAYDEAIRLGKTLDLSVAEYCNALASAYHNKGNVLKDQQALVAAAVAYDEAIRLRKDLDLSVAEYRYNSVTTYLSKGNVLKDQRALTDAVSAYNEAIRLGETLDLSVAEYCFALGSAHHSKGIALQDQDTLQALAEAVTAYNEAIHLRETLDLSVAEYRNDLAWSYHNKGNALKDQGTPQALTAAITAYDKAIWLRKALDLSMAKHRHALAAAYHSKGVTLQGQDTPKALAAAIAAYDEAIRLRETLDQNVVEYRCDLAGSYHNKSNILQNQSTPQALVSAMDANNEAIRLGETLDLRVAKYRTLLISAYTSKGNILLLQRVREALTFYRKAIALADHGRDFSSSIGIEPHAKAYRGAAWAYLRLADPVSAADAADEGLKLLKELEINGVFRLRSLRESLFETTLDAYVQAQQFQWVPDVIREHLDPDEPGSAPASEAMHAAALEALAQSLVTLYRMSRPIVADRLTQLGALARSLAGWHIRYFSGEASSAWLRAMDCEKRGVPEQAEQILHTYIQARPLDPSGPKVLGDWYAQRHQPAAAEAAYREAARVCACSTPPQDDLYARSAHVIALARCLLDLRLLQLSEAATAAAATPDPIATLGKGYDQLHTLLTGEFIHDLVNHSPSHLKSGLWWERLKPELEALWQQAAAQRDDWLTKHAQGMAQEERDKAFKAVLMLTKGLFKGLGRSWEDCQQTVLCALQEIWDYQSAHPDLTDLTELVAVAVREAVERAACALAASELDAAYEHLSQTLEPLWEHVLEEREKRFLGCGWRGLRHSQDEAMRRFAGLHLGLAVEWSLAHRLYAPLKTYWSQHGQPDLGTHRLAPQIDRFLTRPNAHLMLGEMIGALSSALKHAHDAPSNLEKPDHKLAAFIAAFLRQMPHPAALLDQGASAHRRRQLDRINRHRIDCAHPESPPSQEQLEAMWAAVAADPEHGFFRYFSAALLPLSERATGP